MTRSSAVPSDLDRFVTVADDGHERLSQQAVSLRAALEAMRASRSDGVRRIPQWDDIVGELVSSGRRLADDVAAVSEAFRRADAGASAGRPSSKRVVSADDDAIGRVRDVLFLELSRRREWAELGADFSLMQNLQKMSPTEWRAAVFGRACPVLDGDAHYSGGGQLLGPDGRRYPIVVLNVVEKGRTYNADATRRPGDEPVATLRGADPGWVVLGVVQGVTELRPSANVAERFVVGAYGTNPNAAPDRRALPASSYASLVLAPNGMPSVATRAGRGGPTPTNVPPSLGEIRSPAYVRGGDGELMEVDRMQPEGASRATRRSGIVQPNPGARRLGARMGAADLVIQAAEGHRLQESYGNLDVIGYQAVFEENVDGRRRAQVRGYRLYGESDGTVAIDPNSVYLDEDGRIQMERHRFHYGNPVIDDPDKPYRVMQ